MEKHTPGPWINNLLYSQVLDQNGRVLLRNEVLPEGEGPEYEEWKANCILASQAPTLLSERNELKKQIEVLTHEKNKKEDAAILAINSAKRRGDENAELKKEVERLKAENQKMQKQIDGWIEHYTPLKK